MDGADDLWFPRIVRFPGMCLTPPCRCCQSTLLVFFFFRIFSFPHKTSEWLILFFLHFIFPGDGYGENIWLRLWSYFSLYLAGAAGSGSRFRRQPTGEPLMVQQLFKTRRDDDIFRCRGKISVLRFPSQYLHSHLCIHILRYSYLSLFRCLGWLRFFQIN